MYCDMMLQSEESNSVKRSFISQYKNKKNMLRMERIHTEQGSGFCIEGNGRESSTRNLFCTDSCKHYFFIYLISFSALGVASPDGAVVTSCCLTPLKHSWQRTDVRWILLAAATRLCDRVCFSSTVSMCVCPSSVQQFKNGNTAKVTLNKHAKSNKVWPSTLTLGLKCKLIHQLNELAGSACSIRV